MDPAVSVEVAAMSRQRAMEMAIAKGDSKVQMFYHNTTVFITGGSGFMGKQMIEKMLRSCELSKIFLLLRPKKGKDIQERLEAIFQNPVFDKLRQQQPNFMNKITAIEGDVASIRLGISDVNWETITNEVEVIFHIAATTRFDEALRRATMINVRGTRETLLLARECKKLKSYIQVSTAYTHALKSLVGKVVDENFHTSPVPPETLIKMAESMDEERFNSLTGNMIDGWPNSYSFTKTVAEELVRTMSGGMPVAVVRPGIVISTYREPVPGWLDESCVYGATGVIVGIGVGLLHVLYVDTSTQLGLVPCDYVNNAIIVAGTVANITKDGTTPKIYNVTAVPRNTFLQGNISRYLNKHIDTLATPVSVYFCFALETSNKLLFTILTWLLHFIPAYVADFICMLLGKKQQYVKLYNKIYKMTITLSFYLLNTWIFDDKNLEDLHKGLSKTDQMIFNFDITSVDWEECMQLWAIGTRKYIFKDGLKETRAAARKQYILKYLHYFVVTPTYLYCLWRIFCFGIYVLAFLLAPITSQICKM